MPDRAKYIDMARKSRHFFKQGDLIEDLYAPVRHGNVIENDTLYYKVEWIDDKSIEEIDQNNPRFLEIL